MQYLCLHDVMPVLAPLQRDATIRRLAAHDEWVNTIEVKLPPPDRRGSE
jgi:hypothetical protein